MKCESCKKEADEVCPDGCCRECHVSLSFEDCCDGTWNARQVLAGGLPIEEVRKAYPDARI